MPSPNETSPLLAKTVRTPVDSDGISTQDSEDRNNGNALSNGQSRRRIDEESQEEEASRETQYEGLPEVKKQFKFILPAVAVGVCRRGTPNFIILAS